MKLIFRSFLFGFFFVSSLYAQSNSGVILSASNSGAYRIIERSDWSRYDNGRYIGLTYREVRATLHPVSEGSPDAKDADFLLYQGDFYVLEETLRNMRQSARAVNDIVPASFALFPNGEIDIADDRGFPSLRGFPSFPSEPVRPGAKWIANAVRVLDPLNEGYTVAVPFAAEYEYIGIELYNGIQVHRVSARYATRFQALPEMEYDVRCFSALQGSHQVDILLRVSDGLPLMMRDTLDETYTWPGGRTVRFRGFTLTFGEGIIPLNPETLIASINDNDINIEDSNIEMSIVPGGLRLTVKDIRFVPDSDEFLADEYPRLDIIAEALRQMPDRNFLVEGHTAAVGLFQGEMELSILRAKRMVDELVRRGISADRFMYKGWGGERPIGDNSTEAGRALNRRVEITILD